MYVFHSLPPSDICPLPPSRAAQNKTGRGHDSEKQYLQTRKNTDTSYLRLHITFKCSLSYECASTDLQWLDCVLENASAILSAL
jgi:hypothetical protein